VPRSPFTRVAVLMFDRTPLFETSVPISVFGVDRTTTGAPAFELLAVAGEPGQIVSTGGVQLVAPHDLAAVADADVVVVPSWRDPDELPPQAVVDALVRAHDRGATIVGLCLGAFVLAGAGLLDGRRVATHWLHAPTLARRYPNVRVDPSVLYVDDGDVVTSAGTAAGIDACLHVVRTAHGARAAAAIARRMVVAPQRTGGQAQFIDQVVPEHVQCDDLTDALDYALGHLREDLDVDDLVARAHMSRRTFDRRFRARLGTSPHQWLLHQRILHAQRLLEDTDLTIDSVAARVGFGTAVTMRPHFRRLVGVSPATYRQTYRPEASETVSA
jgi:transcriptional regulator GlxA family with amidase domain